mgnify:CR=1 FL=1
MRSSQQEFLLRSRHDGAASETARFLQSATQNSGRMNAPGTQRLCGGHRRCPRASRCPSCTWRKSILGTLRCCGRDRTPPDVAFRKFHTAPAAGRTLGEAPLLSPELRARKFCKNCAATLCHPASSRLGRRIRSAPCTGRICRGTCAIRSSSWLVRRHSLNSLFLDRPPHFSRFPNALTRPRCRRPSARARAQRSDASL